MSMLHKARISIIIVLIITLTPHSNSYFSRSFHYHSNAHDHVYIVQLFVPAQILHGLCTCNLATSTYYRLHTVVVWWLKSKSVLYKQQQITEQLLHVIRIIIIIQILVGCKYYYWSHSMFSIPSIGKNNGSERFQDCKPSIASCLCLFSKPSYHCFSLLV